MRGWQIASGIFFLYIAGVAAVMRGLDATRRRLVVAGACGGLIVAAGAGFAPQPAFAILNDWIVPPALLLVGYWTSGLLFVAPMPRAERVLMGIDRALGIRRIAAATPRAIAELLEVAYAAVYPVIPAALILHLTLSSDPDPARFWTVILATDCVCFGMLPWIQTRPPRALETEPPWTSHVRVFNLRLLGTASIQANTFPSGHAAEALAAALLVLDAPIASVLAMFAIALAISAGAVLGRYHYAADALAGWAVAAAVWLLAAGVR